MTLEENIKASVRQERLRRVERYNRRCRRIVSLVLAGRKIDDHVLKYRTDMMRIGYELDLKDLVTA